MQIINMDAQTFEAMLSMVENCAKRMEHLYHQHGNRESIEWMDNQDVCQLLNISPRTLQTLRDNRTLAYSQISHKTYYKPEDVQKILSVVEEKRKQVKDKGKQI
jgi:phage-related protein